MMGVIDAHAHVIETEQTWSFMLEEERRFAPELLVSSQSGVKPLRWWHRASRHEKAA